MRRNHWGKPSPQYVEAETQVRVRFQEVDALRVVWHGHYLTYFEEGRTAFGRKFGLGYQDILDAGYTAPLVHIEVDYFAPARMDEIVTVQTRLHQDSAARIQFTYVVTNESGLKLATGFSVQAFTDLKGQLVLTRPEFYSAFMRRMELEVFEVTPSARDCGPDS